MLTLLVTNTKGGCGKSTVSTGLAGAFATAGLTTALADVDPQRSSLTWTTRRPPSAARVQGLDWVKQIGAIPSGIERLVIDAPAAMKISDTEELLRMADIVVLPVLPSAFDQDATNRFLSKLEDVKKVRKGRIPVAVVGNRLRPRTKAATKLDSYLSSVGHSVVTRLRDSSTYAELAESGLSLFDLNTARSRDLREDWLPLLAFLKAP